MKFVKSTFLGATLSIALSLTGCGSDSSKAESERDLERSNNRELQAENEKLKREFGNVIATKNYIWVFRGAFMNFDAATVSCKEIGFRLPNSSEIEEYKALNAEKFEDLKTLKFKGSSMTIHMKNATESAEHGIALCVKKNG